MQLSPPISTSLIIPVFNGALTLDDALASVAAQSIPIDQVIAVNDGSTDETPRILERWRGQLPLVVINNGANLGCTESLRIGLECASGDLIFRLDADDIWLPQHVKILLDLSLYNPDAVLFSSLAHVLNSEGETIRITREVDDDNIRAKLFWDNPLVHSAVAFRRHAYEEVGGYIHSSFAQDYDLLIRLLKFGRYAGTKEATIFYRVLSNSLSRIERNQSLCVRLGLEILAIRFFGMRHPFSAVRLLPVILLRAILNGIRSL